MADWPPPSSTAAGYQIGPAWGTPALAHLSASASLYQLPSLLVPPLLAPQLDVLQCSGGPLLSLPALPGSGAGDPAAALAPAASALIAHHLASQRPSNPLQAVPVTHPLHHLQSPTAPEIAGLAPPMAWPQPDGGQSGSIAAAAAAVASHLAPAGSSALPDTLHVRPQQAPNRQTELVPTPLCALQAEPSLPHIASNTALAGSNCGTQAGGGNGCGGDAARSAGGDEADGSKSAVQGPASSEQLPGAQPRKSRYR
jgi:hypothetical protein